MKLKNPPKYCYLLREFGLNREHWPHEYPEKVGSGAGQFADMHKDELSHSIETSWGHLVLRADSASGRLCRTISIQFNSAKAVPNHAAFWTAAVLRRLQELCIAPPVSCPASAPSLDDQSTTSAVVADFQFWGDNEKTYDAFNDFCDWIENRWLEFIHAQVGLIIGKNLNHIAHEIDGGELAYIDPYSGLVSHWNEFAVADALTDQQYPTLPMQ
jgi:hypothetical protein